jgi:hypothetical protein
MVLSEEGADAGLGAPDEELLDLGGAFVERHDAGVTHVLLDRVLINVAIPTEGLDGKVCRPDRGLGREVLGL